MTLYKVTKNIRRIRNSDFKFIKKKKSLDEHEVKAAIIGSVVPNIMHSLTSGLIKYFDVKPIIVGPGIKTGINLGRFNPREVGADRIVILSQDMRFTADRH